MSGGLSKHLSPGEVANSRSLTMRFCQYSLARDASEFDASNIDSEYCSRIQRSLVAWCLREVNEVYYLNVRLSALNLWAGSSVG